MAQNPVASSGDWAISKDERNNYDKQFEQLNPSGGYLRGDRAKVLFLQSNLPPDVLRQIWDLADFTKDGKMDKLEFAIAMKLIKLKRQGAIIPKALPPVMKKQPVKFDISAFAQTSLTTSSSGSSVFDSITASINTSSNGSVPPTFSISGSTPVMSNGALTKTVAWPGMNQPPTLGHMVGPSAMQMPLAMPGPGVTNMMPVMPVAKPDAVDYSTQRSVPSDWAIPKTSKLKYNQMFNANDLGKSGFISGMQARFLLKQTNLPEPVLAQIWNISDIDGDGKLTQEEFVLAMHFTDIARSGGIIPSVLPETLMPPSYRRFSNATGNVVAPFPNPLGNIELEKKQSDPVSLLTTFEDKRRDNFNKGNIELERRRQALEENQRKEKERLERKEREERERRERERLELERRRQIQLERQLELQQAAEREKEEARKRAIEQREAAQKEMERQRKLEFERLRRQELLQQKLREQETVTSLHAKTKELDVEIIALDGKKDQLGVRVLDLKARENEQKMAVEAMNRSRDAKLSAVAQRQMELKDLGSKMSSVFPEKQNVLEQVNNIKQGENSDFNSSLKSNRDTWQQTIASLRSKVEDGQKKTTSKLAELNQLHIQLNSLREDLNKHRLEVEALNRVQQDKVRDLQQARREKEASLLRKNSMEKMKRQQQKAAAGSHMKILGMKPVQKRDAEKSNNTEKSTAWTGGEVTNLPKSTAWTGGEVTNLPKSTAWTGGEATNLPKSTAWSGGEVTNVPNALSTSQQAEQIKKEDVKRKIAEMQQKRMEQKKMVDVGNVVNKEVADSQSLSHKAVDLASVHLKRYRALYKFEARNADELTIDSGDIVMIDESKDTEPGWYYGSSGDRSGWFPVNYVEAADSSTPVAPGVVSNSDSKPAPVPKNPQPPPQSVKPNRAAAVEPIQSSEKSAFRSTSRITDASPIPGQGLKISGLKCCALYPWQAKKDNHLTFEKDAVIDVTEQQTMWWFGSSGGNSGWFPKAYVKEIQSSIEETKQKSHSPSVKRKAPDVPETTKVAADSPAKEYVASYSFTSKEKGDLTFEAGETVFVTEMDGDWWTGRCGDRTGIFPANYVALKEEQRPSSGPSAASPREIANVIAPYTASAANQLSLKMGQLVLIKKKNDSGWWEGELQARGQKKQVGWFPANYVRIRTARTTQVKTLGQVMAMYDYTAQNEDEISFSRGSIVCITDRSDSDWWTGYLKSNSAKQGLFPSNYVREMNPEGSSGATQWTLQQRALSPEEIKRQQRIHELIVSEESYLKDLEMANTGFQIPLKEKGLLTEQEVNSLFVNWNELIMCSAKLVKAFRVRRKHSGDGGPGAVVSLIGDILCEQLPHLHPYVRFCSCQLKASSLLQEKIDNDPEFKKFVKTCESGNSFKGLPVSSYLVKPMQRITKYPLLIEKILKHTHEGHTDHNHLKLALERAEDICSQVNEGVREKENADRLEWLQSHINLEGLNDRLVFNSATNCLGQRRYIHCGTLYKHKSNKELVGFLFNDFLLLTTATRPLNIPVNDFIFSSKTNPQFRLYKMPIFLNEVLTRLPTDPTPPGGNSPSDEDLALFHLSHVDRVYTLRAENVNERTAWTGKIKTASQIYIDTEKKKREKAYHARSQRTAGIGRLMVIIVEGCNLVKNSVGRNDPYCEVTMGVQSHSTKTVQDTVNPKWGTSMQFFVKDVLQDVLCISVFQRDMFSPDDFLGRTEIKVSDIKKDMAPNKGPLTKRLLLHEVESGEVVVKVDLQLFGNNN